jgi:hypothetical protein
MTVGQSHHGEKDDDDNDRGATTANSSVENDCHPLLTSQQTLSSRGGRSAKSGPSMLTREYVLLHGGLAIATVMEMGEKATTDLSAASSTRTTTTKTLAMMTTLREGSAIGPASAAFSYCHPTAIVLH